MTVREADPDPAPGPAREALLRLNQDRLRAGEEAMTLALSEHLKRVGAVVAKRARGPKARKGTKWWGDSAALATTRLVDRGDAVEVKKIDAQYVVPDKFGSEVADAVRPVAMRIATQAAGDVATRLGVTPHGGTDDGLFAIDTQAVERAVEDAIGQLLGATQRHVEDLRKRVLDADEKSESLDEMVDNIEQANQRGGKWLLLRGRDLAHSLAQAAAHAQARALGVRTTQWLSRRDERVRPTHVRADGQRRALSDQFRVGDWKLRYPGDPKDLPGSWEEVGGCRCVLLFAKPNKATRDALKLMGERTTPGKADSSARRLISAAGAAEAVPAPQNMSGRAARVPLTEPAVAYRVLDAVIDAVPGQRLLLPVATTLGLAAPVAFTAAAPVLTVLIPAGVTVTVAGGAVALAQGAQLEVVGVSETGVEAVVVGP